MGLRETLNATLFTKKEDPHTHAEYAEYGLKGH